jgi:hypothetical protein
VFDTMLVAQVIDADTTVRDGTRRKAAFVHYECELPKGGG